MRDYLDAVHGEDPLLALFKRGGETDQRRIAMALGYGADVAAMNEEHDRLHKQIAAAFHIPSRALKEAAGHELTRDDAAIAKMEEFAVLALQRYLRVARRAP